MWKTTIALMALCVLVGCEKAAPMDQTFPGELTSGDSRIESDNSLYDEYPIRVESGWRITAEMTSTEFDSLLLLIDPSGDTVAQHDDIDYDAGNLNARIEYTALRGGRYRVLANGMDANQSGAYSLHITTGP